MSAPIHQTPASLAARSDNQPHRGPRLPKSTGHKALPEPRLRWAIVETFDSSGEYRLIFDGPYPRHFTKPNRLTIGCVPNVGRLVPSLIIQVVRSRRSYSEQTPLSDGRPLQIVAHPVFAPSGDVYAVALWAGTADEEVPSCPIVGVVEWTQTGVGYSTPAARELLGNSADSTGLWTIPGLLSKVDRLDDRAGFLSLFDLIAPQDEWIGFATVTRADHTRRHIYIAARAFGRHPYRTVRSIGYDITEILPPPTPSSDAATVRNLPIPEGHAMAVADLRSGIVHQWLTNADDPQAGWSHHRPEIHPADTRTITDTLIDLLARACDPVAPTASTRARIRFDANADWIELHGQWRLIYCGDRPQALIDITTELPVPPVAVSECAECRRTSSSGADAEPSSIAPS
ncbi:GAF domain-containing protein [Nocardia aurantia]|uniref:Rv3651-like N-terminal domain-containing protein n=1 Tax=Nocardia aurantia TaxID=2585199 RepID=A0A7K0DT22_9NOCA|nr:GAF domain-containing protein [Nocardia aurantia]MQY28919.1 hypothetical protein [Nocardia aurantia]